MTANLIQHPAVTLGFQCKEQRSKILLREMVTNLERTLDLGAQGLAVYYV